MPDPAPLETTYRWRRRRVMHVRVTWLAMVLVLALLIFFKTMERLPTIGQGGKVLGFILIVILPMVAVGLWRAGLLPPERVRADFPDEP